jgi:D-lactate dehydrogenase
MLAATPDTPVQVVDAMTFVVERVLPRLGDHPRLASITVHPTCSSTQLGINASLTTLAEAVAEQVNVPVDWGCCAFAGDRGLLHPELTEAATGPEAREVRARPSTAYASCNRTCEVGMTRATGQTYRHVLEHLADVVRSS